MPANARVLAAVNRRRAMDQILRAQMAQQSRGGQGGGGRGVQIGPVGVATAARRQQQGVQVRQNVDVNAAREQYRATVQARQKAQEGPGGIGGFLGGILSNPIVSTLTKPLSLLSYPKNLAIASLAELDERTPWWLEAMSGIGAPLLLMDEDRSRADKRGFWTRVADPNYGFGSVAHEINTGNDAIDEWGNRGVGLWGDIALDPLTYASAGMNKIPGATGRVSLAAEAEKLGLSEDVIRAAGRYGARGVRNVGDEAAVQALKLPEPGLRFGGELGVRVPGTRKIGEATDLALQALRFPATDTGFGQAVRRLGAARNPATREAVESLVSRGGERYTPSVAAGLVRTEWEKQAAARAFTGALENTGRDIARVAKDDPALTHALETGDLSNKAVEVWHDLNTQIRDRQLAADVSVGELADEDLNWVPRMLTKEGKEDFSHATSKIPGTQTLAPESQQYARAIKRGGQYEIRGKLFTPVEGTIKEANDWALRELGHKLYEDSPAKLSAYAIEQASDAVGKVARLRGLFETGSQKLFGTGDKRVTHIDDALTRAASKETGGELADVLEPILRDVSAGETRVGQTGQALDEANQMLAAAQRGSMRGQRQAYGEAYQTANEAQSAFDAATAGMGENVARQQRLTGQLGEAQAAETAARQPVDELRQLADQGVQGPRMLDPVAQQEMDRLQAIYDQFDAQRLAATTPNQERQAIGQMVAAKRQMDDIARKYTRPAQGAPLPEAAPLEDALTQATARRQGIEAELAPINETVARQQAAVAPDVDAMVAEQVQPRLNELAAGTEPFRHYRNATDMADVMADVALGMSEREFDEAIAHLPESAQAMMKATVAGDRSEPVMGKLLDDIRQGKLDDQIVRQANEGYELMKTDRLMGRDVIIDSEMRQAMADSDEAMRNFNRVVRQEPGLLGKVVDEYTKFFKAWATATPGFHVRNAMSATFMNMTEGVTFREMLDGNLIWKTWRAYGGGSELARRASNRLAPEVDWVSHLPERLQAVAPDVVSAVYASGAGGRYGAAELGQRAFGETAAEGSRVGNLLRKTYENRALQASHNVGEHVEGRVRAGLALHALGPDASGSWVDAVQRIKRVHFDYSEVNQLDARLRRIIPFWTFMSRNLPLQIQQMWTAPRAYAQYQSVMRNVDADPEGNLLMPNYLQRAGGRFIGGDFVLSPDVGASQVDQYLGQIADPKSLLSNLNPIIKDPLQLATNQNFFYGDPYKANDYQRPGIESALPAALLTMFGVGENTDQGPVQERKVLDAIRDLIPINAQINRLGSTTADREGKGLASQLAYLGIPVRTVNQDTERRNRQIEARGSRRDELARRKALAKFGGAA